MHMEDQKHLSLCKFGEDATRPSHCALTASRSWKAFSWPRHLGRRRSSPLHGKGRHRKHTQLDMLCTLSEVPGPTNTSRHSKQ